MDKKISIIIPCYNVENYIDRCFESIYAQTIGFENLEIIFVNDASTDSTLEKLTSIEERYPDNILIINLEENARPGAARNLAIEYANAPYIGYVDSDDWIDADMYERMLNALEKNDCDFVECHWNNAYSKTKYTPVKKLGRDGFYDLTDPAVRSEFFGNQIALTAVWNKLFKKDFLIDNEIYFPEKLRYEDIYFNYLVFLYAKRYFRINEPLYHYFCNEDGIVLQRGKSYQFDKMDIADLFFETCKVRGLYDLNPENKFAIDWMFLEKYYIYMLWEVFNQFPDISYECYTGMRAHVLELIPDYGENPYRKWESNAFDSFMLKLLDKPLSKETLLNVRESLIKKFNQ